MNSNHADYHQPQNPERFFTHILMKILGNPHRTPTGEIFEKATWNAACHLTHNSPLYFNFPDHVI